MNPKHTIFTHDISNCRGRNQAVIDLPSLMGTLLTISSQKASMHVWLDKNYLLGKGSYGRVYRGYKVKNDGVKMIATNELGSEVFAIKVSLTDRGDCQQEVNIAKNYMTIYPPIKSVCGTTSYTVMEYFSGDHLLASVCREELPLPLTEHLRIIYQIVMQVLHMQVNKNHIHRDIKPENIMLNLLTIMDLRFRVIMLRR